MSEQALLVSICSFVCNCSQPCASVSFDVMLLMLFLHTESRHEHRRHLVVPASAKHPDEEVQATEGSGSLCGGCGRRGRELLLGSLSLEEDASHKLKDVKRKTDAKMTS